MRLQSTTEKLGKRRRNLIEYIMGAVMGTGKMRHAKGKHRGSAPVTTKAQRIRKRKLERLNKQKGRA